MEFFEYIFDNGDRIFFELLRHLQIIGIALPIAIAIGVPIGIAISNHKKTANVVIYIASVLMTIPSLALFGFMVALLAPFNAGIGVPPAVIAVVV